MTRGGIVASRDVTKRMHILGGCRFVAAVAGALKNGCDKAQPSEAMTILS